jgi:hypothetical protein
MIDLKKIPSFINWRESKFTKSHFDLNISDDEITANWVETYMIDEVPKNDVWKIYSTDRKIALEDLYVTSGIIKECTRHYMDITPTIDGELKKFVDTFAGQIHHSTFLKLPAGCSLIWHYDSYSAFVKFKQIPEEKYHKIRRSAIMLRDWDFGQAIQIGGEMISNWKKGDIFTWQGDVWHGAGNFGLSDITVLQVTFLDD